MMAPDPRFAGVRSISMDFDGVLSTLVLGRRWVKTKPKQSHARALSGTVRIFESGLAILTQRWRRPYPHAGEVLCGLRAAERTLYVLTSRADERIAPAEKWLERRGWRGLFERSLFNIEGEAADRFKERMLRENPIEAHIDDDPETVAYLAGLFPDRLFVHLDHDRGPGLGVANVATVRAWDELAALFGVKPKFL